MRVMTTAGSSRPISVLARMNGWTSSSTPLALATTGAKANACPTVKNQTRNVVRG